MNELSIEQRQKLTDYSMGLLGEAEAAEVETLLAESEPAREFLGRVEKALSPLKSLPEPEAPDSLVALTMARVRSAAALEGQQEARGRGYGSSGRSSRRTGPWQLRLPELLTMAASIAIVVGMLVPALRHARIMSLRDTCAAQQAAIGGGMRSYAAAHGQQLPFQADKVGQSWMRSAGVGPKKRDSSNLFLLVKLGYVQPEAFICPGVGHSQADLHYGARQLEDFPSEAVVSYSYQNMFGPKEYRPTADSPPGFVVLADRNPLLMLLGRRISLAKLFLAPSPNHGADPGQNVLRLDWSVSWSDTPKVGLKSDNIWYPANFRRPKTDLPEGRSLLQGLEVPSNAEDSFLH